MKKRFDALKIATRDVRFGMSVLKLDRPWSETPFMLQGFRVRTADELRLLNEYCGYVYVDAAAGRDLVAGLRGERVALDEHGELIPTSFGFDLSTSPAVDSSLPAAVEVYATTSTFADELPLARSALTHAKLALRHLTELLRSGGRISLDPLKRAAGALEDSILRNPDPAMLLRALHRAEPFSFRHAAHSAVLALALGRGLGLRRPQLHDLALGVLLCDIGKLRMPKELLRASGRFDARESEIMKLHVRFGTSMVEEMDGVTRGVLDVVSSHHERFDGSGYPQGLRGGEIPLLARIAGLADTLDAITSERAYSGAIALHEALRELFAAPNECFQRALVDRFIAVAGAHPLGSLVELSDGTVAMVIAHNPARRLLPWVIKLTAADKRPLAAPRLLDLAGADGGGCSVREVLEAGAHGIEPPGPEVLAA